MAPNGAFPWSVLAQPQSSLMAEQHLQTSRLQSLEEENLRLRRAVEELSILNDLARAISASLNSEEIMQSIIRRSLRAMDAEQGVITLVDERANNPMKTLVRAAVTSSAHEQFHLTQALLGWMHLNKKPLLLNTPRTDERFRGINWDASIETLLCVPMMTKSELKGVLTVYNKKRGKTFSEEDQRLLAIIAAQSAQVVENARLNEREKQLLKMQEEVRLAARIQAELLPKTFPQIVGYDIAGKSIPAQLVGGDYFDFIPIDEHRLAICLGDVSGKGLPASLLMANTQATLRGQAFFNLSPKECIRHSNKLLNQSISTDKFVTLFYGILDCSRHELTFTNAGQDHPYLLSRNEQTRRLHTGGTPLGMLEEFPFEEEAIVLRAGDVIVMSSDGITEAINANQEQFGGDRLEAVINEHWQLPAADLIESILEAVTRHVGKTPQLDDMTLVVVKRDRD
jgi:phosphoserine phosphatase RsbU/P